MGWPGHRNGNRKTNSDLAGTESQTRSRPEKALHPGPGPAAIATALVAAAALVMAAIASSLTTCKAPGTRVQF